MNGVASLLEPDNDSGLGQMSDESFQKLSRNQGHAGMEEPTEPHTEGNGYFEGRYEVPRSQHHFTSVERHRRGI
jgi:hypothetical protein